MENIERFRAGKEAKEIEEFVEAYLKLQAQINSPTRNGMIGALSDAQSVAGKEIAGLERSQGETQPTPWSCIPDDYLYRKLSQYRQGLYIHAVNKFGEEVVKNLLKGYAQDSLN